MIIDHVQQRLQNIRVGKAIEKYSKLERSEARLLGYILDKCSGELQPEQRAA